LCQKWKAKPIFRGNWNSLMAWLDWPRPPWFYDRSTLSERIVGHPLPVSTPSACWLQDSDLFPNVGVFVVRGKYRITVYVSVEVCNWTDHLGWRKCQFSISFRQGYVVAPELLLEPMNWIMSCAAHKGLSWSNCGWGGLYGFRSCGWCLLVSQHIGNIC